MVGKTKGEEEKEPEGRAVVGPSREAIVYNSGNTPLFFSNKSFHELFYTTFYCIILLHDLVDLHHKSCFPSYLGPSCLQMSPTKRVKQWQRLRRSRSWRWYKIGWRWEALPEEEAWGLLCEVFPSFYLWHSSVCLYFLTVLAFEF